MERIDDILRGELLGRTFDCECGRRHHVPTRVVDAAPGAIDRVPAVLSEVAAARSALVIADRRTWQAAGAGARRAGAAVAADRALLADGADGQLHASVEAVERLEAATAGTYDLYIAAGSGTVNDITKELARRRGRPYLVVATAASMNGYTSSIVALLDRGLKTTGQATPPLAVVADPEVLAAVGRSSGPPTSASRAEPRRRSPRPRDRDRYTVPTSARSWAARHSPPASAIAS
jgi:glycerol-1-phosphate dehydrogenase [NAD(P)+]